ncbi:MAG: PA14 domain-containing protein, partial [Myxococcota bacterium]|nr:PA14 domain-containing protein [Myxococcota bacterium]
MAADAEPAVEPAPWHVSNAEIRVPVQVDVKAALLRMPPQVYLADLKPLEITGGLAFNPENKDPIKRDIRKPEEKAATIAKEKERYKKAKTEWDPKAYSRLGEKEGGPILRVSGSVTVAIRPEHKHFSWGPSGAAKVYIDGKLLTEDSLLQVTWKEGENFKNTYKERRLNRLAPIPPGAKTLKLEMIPRRHSFLTQAGFITRSPGVARATICLPGHDPSRLVPIAHRSGGERVGCRTVWAEAGKPMSIFFDSSSGDEEYWVYLVDKAKQPAPLDWTPQAELVEEVRSLDRYDPKLETLDGFLKLWEGSGTIMGRGVPLYSERQSGPSRPARVIYRGSMPFRSKGSDRLNVRKALASRPAWLSRLGGTFHIPATDHYRFVSMCGPAGYVLLDGQLVAPFQGNTRARFFEIELEKGPHRIEFLQYAHAGQNGGAGLWWKDPRRKDLHGDYEIGWPRFGEVNDGPYGRTPSLMLWEPMADATTAPMESRSPASWASFSCYQHANLGAVYPGHDLNWYRFGAHAPGGSTNAVYRWRFDDGRTAEGQQVTKLFLRSGMRKVQLEVLDAPGGRVIARAAGEVNVQINLAHTKDFRDKGGGDMVAMMWEFAEEEKLAQLPLDDLVNLYEWSYPLKHWGASRMVHDPYAKPNMGGLPYVEARELAGRRIRDGLARRVDEVIAAYPYSQLLQIAQSLSRKANSPTDASYAVAEKLLTVVMDRSPAGSSHWREAALGLSDIKLLVRGKAELAVALLKKIDQIGPAVDILERWQFADAREYHYLLARDKLAGLTQGLDWSPISWQFRTSHNIGLSFRYHFDKGHGFWVAKTFDLPADWKGKQLIFKDGLRGGARGEYVWINGEPLGRMWQWPDGNIVIPERFLKKGGENRITWLIQPAPWQGRGEWASPNVSADLSRSAFVHDARIQLVGDKGKRRDLGQLSVLGGALHDTPRSLAFSPDGGQLASGHEYGSVRLWDVDVSLEAKGAPKETHTISVAPVSVVSLAFSPDGKRLATGSEDARITLLDPISGKRTRSFIGHASAVLALAFSPDGKRLASAGHDRSVKIWDTSSGKELLTLGVHAGPVHAVAYSPDGKSVATAIDASHIRLWDATTGKALRTLEGHQGEVLSLAFSPDGKRLVAGYREGFVNQWDLASGKKLTTVHHKRKDDATRDAMVTKVLFSLDGKQLASLGWRVARKWDSETGGKGREFADFGYGPSENYAWLRRPSSGPNRLVEGFENYPVELYTSEACDEPGMNYASYAGKWDKLPDFDKQTPVKKGVLKHIDPKHLSGVMLPYWKITKKDGRNDKIAQPSGLRVTGYLRVKKAGDYAFSLQSRDGSRLLVGSKMVIDNDGVKEGEAAEEVKHGTVHLEPGVHSFVLTYFNTQDSGSLNFTFPDAFVRPLTVADMESSRLMAGALLAQGKPEQAKSLLTKLHRDGWPLSEEEQEHVEQARMR